MSHIESRCPILGLEPPEGAASFRTIEESAQFYLGEIQRIQPRGPYSLLGWSIGGVTAHAIATRLQDLGESVSLLALLDAYPSSETDGEGVVAQLDADINDWTALSIVAKGFGIQLFPDLSDQADVHTLLDRLAQEQIISTSDRTSLLEMVESYKRANALWHTFTPRTFRGDVIFFRALHTEEGPTRRTVASWAPHVSGNIEVYELSTDHYGILDSEFRPRIGAVLSAKLCARSGGSP